MASADPEILEKKGETMYQHHCHSSQLHTTNYIPFIRGKGSFLKKIVSH